MCVCLYIIIIIEDKIFACDIAHFFREEKEVVKEHNNNAKSVILWEIFIVGQRIKI